MWERSERVHAGRRSRTGPWAARILFVALVWSGTHSASGQVVRAPGPERSGNVRQADARLRAQSADAEKPLPRQILATPGVQEEMEVIRSRSQLIVTRQNVTRTAIANPSILEVVQYSPNELAIIGLELGSTTVTFWFEGEKDPLIYLVTVIRDPSFEEQQRIDYGKLERKLALLFPNSKVYLIPLSSKIVVKGQAQDAEEAAKILQIVRGEVINQEGSLPGPQPIGGDLGTTDADVATGFANELALESSYVVNMLEVPGEYQVQLRVRIAELSREQLRQMGVDFSALFNDARHLVTSSVGGLPSTLTGIFENGEIDVFINWLASNGTARILSEPTLTVLSGHPASFLSGGEFAVPTIVGIGGAQGQTTTFRGFGTSLVATPTVLDRDLIRMRIVPEFSQVNNSNSVQGIPGVDSRRVQTTVELREGQTVAIAGLIARTTNTEISRIPFLGDIPWVGTSLFAAKRSTEDETELLILVTPEIVRPMDAGEVPPVPGHEVTHPSDHQLYFHAMTEGPPDTQVYQLAPYGRGAGHGIPVGYSLFEPAPASPLYPPQPTSAYSNGMPYPTSPSRSHTTPAPHTRQGPVRQRPRSRPPQPQPPNQLPPPSVDPGGSEGTLPPLPSGSAGPSAWRSGPVRQTGANDARQRKTDARPRNQRSIFRGFGRRSSR